jgi:hypothetical protein
MSLIVFLAAPKSSHVPFVLSIHGDSFRSLRSHLSSVHMRIIQYQQPRSLQPASCFFTAQVQEFLVYSVCSSHVVISLFNWLIVLLVS